MFRFEIIHQSTISRARVGRITTPHGIIETPGFVPVGTHATIKALESQMVKDIGVQVIFCNTYHLLLHPGPEIVRSCGGLHTFANWDGPLITDSGGFQIFSLAYGTVHDELKSRGQKKQKGSILSITEEGVLFRSYRDGTPIMLSPESSVEAQKALGADIIIPLDELPPYHIDPEELKQSFDRTHRWQKRSLKYHLESPQNQAMYAVVHGGVDNALRKKSCDDLSKLPFDGFAIGGSLGKNRDEMISMLTAMMPYLPYEKPTHLLGIGDAASLGAAIPLGIDTFDSSYPTRCARHGLLFTRHGMLKIQQSIYKDDYAPVDETCSCLTCTGYSRSYVHHLFKAKEITGLVLATIHNLTNVVQLMTHYRTQIIQNKL